MARKKNTKTALYNGPEYSSRLLLPGIVRAQDPKSWSQEKIKQMCERYPRIARYFSFEEAKPDPDEEEPTATVSQEVS